jgi:hypothetical protein
MDIVISTETTPQHQVETLLHEVLHAISNALDLQLTEHQVFALSTGVYAVCMDNPALVDLLKEGGA